MRNLLPESHAGEATYKCRMGALVSPQTPLKNATYGLAFRHGGHPWSDVRRRVAGMQRLVDFGDQVLHERPAAGMRNMPATSRASGRGMQAI